MTQNIPAFSSSFPSAWIVEDSDDEPSNSRSTTPIPEARASLSTPLSPSPSPVSTPTALPVTPTKSSPGPSKYVTHFPSSWVLPQSSSPSPTPTSHSLRHSISLGTSPNPTLRPQSLMRVDQRSATAFDLGPQIGLWKQLSKGQSLSIPREDEDRLENFRVSLNARLSQSVNNKGLGWDGKSRSYKSWCVGMPEPTHLAPPQQRAQSLEVGDKDGIHEEDFCCRTRAIQNGNEDEEDDYYGSGYGDVPHQVPAVADAYSTRGSSSVTSH
jgi:hypothetical protein